jgi:hypothetical protein
MRVLSVLLLIGIMVMSCDVFHKVHEVQIVAVQPAADSWAQDNLKQHDDTCKTMIYRAPNGILELC